MSQHGHLFVVHGDLTQLHADDVLLPCDTQLNVTRVWARMLGATEPGDADWVRPIGLAPPEGFDLGDRPPLALSLSREGPQVWLFNSGGRPGDLDWLLAGIRAAVAQVCRSAAPARFGRARRLVAMPLFGVGAGGFDHMRGAVLDGVLTTLEEAVASPDAPDVALVLYKRADYAAVQSRRRMPGDADMMPGVVEHLMNLARLERDGGLVLFLGAGASAGAGFPTWSGLLEELAAKAELSSDEQHGALRMPAPDAADVIASALSDGLGQVVAERFTQDGCALTHALLASLRVTEAVTTNYDTLYENATQVPHTQDLCVLPRQRRESDQPWLLKLHGDVEVPDSIVLTREHYLRFDVGSAPLAAVVQSLMVTKHMLFIGYSLSDENFIRLARQVRELFHRTGTHTGPVGTVLSLFPDPARERLWRDDLRFVTFSAPKEERNVAVAARRLEIFLDQLALASCDEAAYVLDDRYRGLLSDEDVRLADAMGPVAEAAMSTHQSAAWRQVTDLLRELGWSGPWT